MDEKELKAVLANIAAATVVSLLLGLGLGLVVGMQISMAFPSTGVILLVIGWSILLATTAFAVGARKKARLEREKVQETVEVNAYG